MFVCVQGVGARGLGWRGMWPCTGRQGCHCIEPQPHIPHCAWLVNNVMSYWRSLWPLTNSINSSSLQMVRLKGTLRLTPCWVDKRLGLQSIFRVKDHSLWNKRVQFPHAVWELGCVQTYAEQSSGLKSVNTSQHTSFISYKIQPIWFFLNDFHWIQRIHDKIFVKRVSLEPTTSCARNRDYTTALWRHR